MKQYILLVGVSWTTSDSVKDISFIDHSVMIAPVFTTQHWHITPSRECTHLYDGGAGGAVIHDSVWKEVQFLEHNTFHSFLACFILQSVSLTGRVHTISSW